MNQNLPVFEDSLSDCKKKNPYFTSVDKITLLTGNCDCANQYMATTKLDSFKLARKYSTFATQAKHQFHQLQKCY